MNTYSNNIRLLRVLGLFDIRTECRKCHLCKVKKKEYIYYTGILCKFWKMKLRGNVFISFSKHQIWPQTYKYWHSTLLKSVINAFLSFLQSYRHNNPNHFYYTQEANLLKKETKIEHELFNYYYSSLFLPWIALCFSSFPTLQFKGLAACSRTSINARWL